MLLENQNTRNFLLLVNISFFKNKITPTMTQQSVNIKNNVTSYVSNSKEDWIFKSHYGYYNCIL